MKLPSRSHRAASRKRGVVAVIAREATLLVIERSQLVRAPGQLCFPGGAIETGEEEHEALLRELREELAVGVQPVRKLWQRVTHTGVDLSWWLAELPVDETPIPNPSEVAAVSWLTIRQIETHPKLLRSNLEFVQAYHEREFTIDGLLG